MQWDLPLAKPLSLKSGEELTTFRDVAEVFARKFDDTVRWAALDHAIEVMMQAAESGADEDVKAATAQVTVVLRARGLMRR